MKQSTPLQQQQRDLAWLLRITTGASSNLKSALSRMPFVSDRTHKEVNSTILSLKLQEYQLRTALDNLQEPPC